MQRILLYILIVFLIFSGFNQVKKIWEENQKDLDDTYAEVKEGFFSWYKTASETSKELKEKLNFKIEEASEKYERIKAEIEATSNKINEKREQLDQALKEMEEAKKALDALLEKEAETSVETSAETSVETGTP